MDDEESASKARSCAAAATAVRDACEWAASHAEELVGGPGMWVSKDPIELAITVGPSVAPTVTARHTHIAL